MEHRSADLRPSDGPPSVIAGRYVLGEAFAAGGMGTVHLGRIVGAGGFSRVVAIKRLSPVVAGDRTFRNQLLDEARLVSRIRHPNVVPTLDVVEADGGLYIVMEYVHGPSLAELLLRARKSGTPIPLEIAAGILEAALLGLHAAHEARREDGQPLGMVHRDVSPQNILVGADGVSRLIDFGIAKAATCIAITEPGVVKGKTGYMAPEQFWYEPASRQTDVYACSVVLWEAVANRRLFESRAKELRPGEHDRKIRDAIEAKAAAPTPYRGEVHAALDDVVLRGLELEPRDRFPTAEAMAIALRRAHAVASPVDVARWLESFAPDELELAEERIRLFERTPAGGTTTESLHETPNVDASASTMNSGDVRRSSHVRWWIVASVTLGLTVVALASLTKSHDSPRSTPERRSVLPAVDPEASALSSEPSPSARATSPPAEAQPDVAPTPNPRPGGRSGKLSCDPPYTIDAKGHKHYLPACF